MINTKRFTDSLLKWGLENQRPLPWKKTNDPYKIWLSEIILQQTRVEQGSPYYLKFVQAFPTVQSLADADEASVLKLWQGLGYYSRARNLHTTAKYIAHQCNGQFPNTYQDIIKLKGIGPYTAAAIASFAFGLKHPVVDGNVIRLISRLLAIEALASSKEAQHKIHAFLRDAISYADAAIFNQAMMDFGSAICVPQKPLCQDCCFQHYCKAYTEGKVNVLPNKQKQSPKTHRYFHFIDFVLPDGRIILQQRTTPDIWNKLFQLPLIELPIEEMLSEAHILALWSEMSMETWAGDLKLNPLYQSKQALTHRYIHGHFYQIVVPVNINKINQGYYLVERKKVSNFAVPKIIVGYIQTLG